MAIQAVATEIDIPENSSTFSLDETPPGMVIDTDLIARSPVANQ